MSFEVKNWNESLSTCEYAGEIVLSEKRLKKEAARIHKRINSSYSGIDINSALLVLAVNCMYYMRDDSGFWSHFCSLLDFADEDQNWLGPRIEEALLHFHFIEEAGSGPFNRFVNPIREQTGLTQFEIPIFAHFLLELERSFGWSGIRTLHYKTYESSVISHFHSPSLSRFMRGDAGRSLTRDVARSIEQYQRGLVTLEELNSLHGYRNGFFDKLFKEFGETNKRSGITRSKPPLPKLVFLPDYRSVFILFELGHVNDGNYRFQDQIVSRQRLKCTSSMFYSTLSGTYRSEDRRWHDWAIAGWDPLVRPIGLFSILGTYISKHAELMNGHYYYIASHDKEPPEEVLISYVGFVDIPLPGLDYDAWIVEIDISSDLSWAGFSEQNYKSPKSYIQWASAEGLFHEAIEISSVFKSKLPEILIKEPDNFLNGSLALFIDSGSGSTRIMISPNQRLISIDLNGKSSVQGRVWVEPIARKKEFSDMDVIDELTFTLVPDFTLEFPAGLYSPSESPEIQFSTKDSNLSIELDNEGASQGEGKFWSVNTSVEVIEGILTCEDICVSFARRIFRASIRKSSENFTPYFSEEDFSSNHDLVLNGMKQASIDLGFSYENEYTSLFKFKNFGVSGEHRCSSLTFQDASQKFDRPVADICIKHENRIVPTGSIFINCQKIMELINVGLISTDENWFSYIPVDLRKDLLCLSRLKKEPLTTLEYSETDCCPIQLREHMHMLIACAGIFDDTKISDPPVGKDQIVKNLEVTHPNTAELLSWYQTSSVALEKGSPNHEITQKYLARYESIKWRPPLERWQDLLNRLVDSLNSESTVLPYIEDWSEDVIGGYRGNYKSMLANRPNGRDLTSAWISYRSNNLMAASTSAYRLLKNADSPVSDLAAILLSICRMREGYIVSLPPMEYRSNHEKFSQAQKLFSQLIVSIDSKNHNEIHVDHSIYDLLNALPWTSEDRTICDILLCKIEYNIKNLKVNDWLELYLHLALAESRGNVSDCRAIAKALSEVEKNIPSSPAKSRILDLMEIYLDG